MNKTSNQFKGRIAIIGSRGIPAKYGGFETCVETIAPSLAAKGWKVWVGCERGNIKSYKGVSLFYFGIKPFYRIIYDTLYDIYSLFYSSLVSDIVYMLGYGSGIFAFIPKLFGKKLVLNTDGMEWMRDKYSPLEKKILLVSEKSAVLLSDVLVADSKNIQKYFEKTYHISPIYITNGVTIIQKINWSEAKLNHFKINTHIKISPNSYWLVVARLEPENNIHLIIEAFLKSSSSKLLIIIGDFNSNNYEKVVKSKINNDSMNRIIFLGGIYDFDLLNMLRWNCYAYIHGHSAGGTNPSLLEIITMEKIIIAYASVFNKEVGENLILYFYNSEELSHLINKVESNYIHFSYLIKNQKLKINQNYSWSDIIEIYDNTFSKMIK
jgi:rhamnosyltransferase